MLALVNGGAAVALLASAHALSAEDVRRREACPAAFFKGMLKRFVGAK
jgi:hypothetical protein